MRFAWSLAVAALAFAPAVVAADRPANPAGPGMKSVIVHPPRWTPPNSSPAKSTPIGFTTVSHTLYMNNCLPGGCDVLPGWEDSRQNRSSIPQEPSHLDAYSWGDAHWNQLVQCVRDTFADFDIDIVTDDPGTANHFEVMVGGFDYQVQIDGALGVAPFVPCDGQLEDNVMTFVFAAYTSNIDQLCWAVAQEASHAWGLDHELNAQDPMTYLYPPLHKEFQDDDAPCGEEEGNPRECWCGGSTQNSYQYLMDTFGPGTIVPPSVAITSPADGAWVTPGFSVRATVESQLSIEELSLAIDGAQASSATEENPVFTTSASLGGGDHTLVVELVDRAGGSATDSVTVHVTDTCAAGEACGDDFACLGGNCLPEAVEGGLGQACTTDAQCITGQCWSDGTQMLCSDACDAGRVCPDGYDCIGEGDGACWPNGGGDEGGGCAAGASGGAGAAVPLALVGLALFVGTRRRRRRRRA
jgi:hypothetical protein